MSFKNTHLPLPSGTSPCHDGGSGDPVLYIHGAGGLRISPGLDLLARERRVVAPTLPGFDGTERRPALRTQLDLADFAAEIIAGAFGKPCDVIGHSFGASVALWLAIRHPQQVQQLILSGGSPGGLAAPLPTDPAKLRAANFAHPEKAGEQKPEAMQRANFAAAQHYHSAADADLVSRLGDIEALTLILHGTKDGIVPLEKARLLRERIKRSHLLYVYDAAHAIDWDQPERFAGLIGDFLTRGEAFIVHRSEG